MPYVVAAPLAFAAGAFNGYVFNRADYRAAFVRGVQVTVPLPGSSQAAWHRRNSDGVSTGDDARRFSGTWLRGTSCAQGHHRAAFRDGSRAGQEASLRCVLHCKPLC